MKTLFNIPLALSKPHNMFLALPLFAVSLVSLLVSATPLKSQANGVTGDGAEITDFSYMKSHGGMGHQVRCVDNSLGGGFLVERRVDPTFLNVQLQDWTENQNRPSENNAYKAFDVENKKMVSKTYYDCDVFKGPIEAAPSLFRKPYLKDEEGFENAEIFGRQQNPQNQNQQHLENKEECNGGYKNSVDNFRDLSKKIHWFSDEDLREHLTKKEVLSTYRGVGKIRHKSYWGPQNEKVKVSNGILLQCPDGEKDVVITNSHTLVKSDGTVTPPDLIIEHMRFKGIGNFSGEQRFSSVTLGQKQSGIGRYTDDWAVAKLEKPLRQKSIDGYKPKAIKIDPRSSQKYKGCVRFVAWRSFGNEYKYKSKQYTQRRRRPRKQTCRFRSEETGDTASYLINPNHKTTLMRHDCYADPGDSGGAFFACDSGELVGIHVGNVGDKLSNKTPYKETGYRYHRHFNTALLISGEFKEAINKACSE